MRRLENTKHDGGRDGASRRHPFQGLDVRRDPARIGNCGGPSSGCPDRCGIYPLAQGREKNVLSWQMLISGRTLKNNALNFRVLYSRQPNRAAHSRAENGYAGRTNRTSRRFRSGISFSGNFASGLAYFFTAGGLFVAIDYSRAEIKRPSSSRAAQKHRMQGACISLTNRFVTAWTYGESTTRSRLWTHSSWQVAQKPQMQGAREIQGRRVSAHTRGLVISRGNAAVGGISAT